MASLERDPASGNYHVRFRYGGRAFRRSLHTGEAKLARARVGRITETLHLLQNGRLHIPAGADVARYILSDGIRHSPADVRLVTLNELFSTFQSARVPGAKETNTVATEDLHLRHLLRRLKSQTFIQSLTPVQLQQYVSARLKEKCSGGRSVAVETVRKEVATFRVVWNWALRQRTVQGAAPVAGLIYPKRDQKPPFMSWHEIERTVARNGITPHAVKQLWESLYLNRQEVQEILDYIDRQARHRFIYPLVYFVAHTGVRLSEAIRSQMTDVDLVGATVMVREKKRSRTRAITYRRVDLTPQLREVLAAWLSAHPGGQHTFCKPANLHEYSVNVTPIPFTKHMAREHLKIALRGSKWSKLRGFHVFRHSFASNLASQGVDQRIIDAWMGHQTEEMRQRYRHLAPETTKAAILKLLPDTEPATTAPHQGRMSSAFLI